MQRLKAYSVIIGLLTIIPMFSANAGVITWEEVDDVLTGTSEPGEFIDLKASNVGDFHAISQAHYPSRLFYGRNSGSAWPIDNELAYTVSDANVLAVALAVTGNYPLVTYTYGSYPSIYIRSRVDTWSLESMFSTTINVDVMDIDVDSDMHLHCIYTQPNAGTELMYGTTASGVFVAEQIDYIDQAGIPVPSVSVAVDENNEPHFAWVDQSDEQVKYATRTGSYTFDIETVSTATSCNWVKLEMTGPEHPVIGFNQALPGPSWQLNIALGSPGGFYVTDVANTSFEIEAVDLAVATDEGPATSNIYFVYSNAEILYHVYYNAGTWYNRLITTIAGTDDPILEIDAEWNNETNTAGALIRDDQGHVYFTSGTVNTSTPTPTSTPGTHTPTPTPPPGTHTPTPTPTASTCAETGVTILMPSNMYHSGDPCWCAVEVCNAEAGVIAGHPLFVLLDVYGTMFFAPEFNDFDHYLDEYETFEPGITRVDVLPEFIWPADVGSANGIHWISALTDPEMTHLVGKMDTFEFGWN